MRSLLFSIAVVAALNGAVDADDQVLQNPLPLTRVALVSDLDAPLDPDDPGTGGGFQIGTYFQTKLASANAIATCTDGIETTVAAWAKALGLTRMLKDRTATTLSLHYSKTDLPGLFSVRYAVKAQATAQVRVDYYRLDGAEQAPESALDLLDPYRIAALQDDLDKALRCGGGA